MSLTSEILGLARRPGGSEIVLPNAQCPFNVLGHEVFQRYLTYLLKVLGRLLNDQLGKET
jgi:hypothetical protein